MADAIEGLLWETRRLFRALAAEADEALAPLGITASERALIEFLARERGPIGVADLARTRSVSRQHIHQTLSRLRNPRWIEKRLDPADARSAVLSLTDEGRALWRRIRQVDRAILRRLARRVQDTEADAAARTLRTLRAVLEEGRHD